MSVYVCMYVCVRITLYIDLGAGVGTVLTHTTPLYTRGAHHSDDDDEEADIDVAGVRTKIPLMCVCQRLTTIT